MKKIFVVGTSLGGWGQGSSIAAAAKAAGVPSDGCEVVVFRLPGDLVGTVLGVQNEQLEFTWDYVEVQRRGLSCRALATLATLVGIGRFIMWFERPAQLRMIPITEH